MLTLNPSGPPLPDPTKPDSRKDEIRDFDPDPPPIVMSDKLRAEKELPVKVSQWLTQNIGQAVQSPNKRIILTETALRNLQAAWFPKVGIEWYDTAEPDSRADERVGELLKWLRKSRDNHAQWATVVLEGFENVKTEDIGDVNFHTDCVAEYEEAISVVTALEQENERLRSRISEFIEGERARENYD